MPKRKTRTRRATGGALDVVRKVKVAAKNALESLRREIDSTREKLDELVAEEKRFREELFGGLKRSSQTAKPKRRRRRRGPAKPKRPPTADRYFDKLPAKFTLEDVRRLAGKRAPISLAQWSRSKRIKKTATGYRKLKG